MLMILKEFESRVLPTLVGRAERGSNEGDVGSPGEIVKALGWQYPNTGVKQRACP